MVLIRLITILFVSGYWFSCVSCKKNIAAPQSIVGTWAMTNFSGSVFYSEPLRSYKDIYYYNNATKALSATESASISNFPDTASYLINSESWTFNADSSYSINESYSALSWLGPSKTSIYTGKWGYQSNTKIDDGFYLDGNAYFFIDSLIQSSAFVIQSVNNNTLIITNAYTSKSSGSTPSETVSGFTLTFIKS